MSTPLSPLSASVTRILSLSGFPPELKTRDIQAAFSEWETEQGGFKIKWVNDTSLLLVFADAGTAKRAYLQTLLSPPAAFSSPTSHSSVTIKPYDGADAQAVISAVNNRGAHTRGHTSRTSLSNVGFTGGALPGPNGNHARQVSAASNDGHIRKDSAGVRNGGKPLSPNGLGSGQTLLTQSTLNSSIGREPSPTLPSIPTQPPLHTLIPAALTSPDAVASFTDSASETTNPSPPPPPPHASAPPRIGDPGKRMVGHALGIRHPGIAPKSAPTTTEQTVKEVTAGLGGLGIAG